MIDGGAGVVERRSARHTTKCGSARSVHESVHAHRHRRSIRSGRCRCRLPWVRAAAYGSGPEARLDRAAHAEVAKRSDPGSRLEFRSYTEGFEAHQGCDMPAVCERLRKGRQSKDKG